MSPNRLKHNAEHARSKAKAAHLPSLFNPHYHFAIVPVADRELNSPTGPQFRTMQLVSTVRKRDTVYS